MRDWIDVILDGASPAWLAIGLTITGLIYAALLIGFLA